MSAHRDKGKGLRNSERTLPVFSSSSQLAWDFPLVAWKSCALFHIEAQTWQHIQKDSGLSLSSGLKIIGPQGHVYQKSNWDAVWGRDWLTTTHRFSQPKTLNNNRPLQHLSVWFLWGWLESPVKWNHFTCIKWNAGLQPCFYYIYTLISLSTLQVNLLC